MAVIDPGQDDDTWTQEDRYLRCPWRISFPHSQFYYLGHEEDSGDCENG